MYKVIKYPTISICLSCTLLFLNSKKCATSHKILVDLFFNPFLLSIGRQFQFTMMTHTLLLLILMTALDTLDPFPITPDKLSPVYKNISLLPILFVHRHSQKCCKDVLLCLCFFSSQFKGLVQFPFKSNNPM